MYPHMEDAMKELANEIWPMRTRTNLREEESGEAITRKSELKHLWWNEWTNRRMDVVRNCSDIRKEVERKSDFPPYYVCMLLSGENGKKGIANTNSF